MFKEASYFLAAAFLSLYSLFKEVRTSFVISILGSAYNTAGLVLEYVNTNLYPFSSECFFRWSVIDVYTLVNSVCSSCAIEVDAF
jgi:hypothetical protein